MAITFVGSTTFGGTATNGGNVTITLSSMQADDCVIVAVTLGTSRAAPTLRVTSSSTSTNYTQIVSTITSSNAKFGVFRRILPAAETQAIVSGTANASDSTTGVALVFRGVRSTAPEDVTATSTIGSGTTPNSPSITVASSNCAIITAVGAQINDTTVTAPTSFLNQIDRTSNDNWDTTTGQAWLTLASTSAFDPASWTNFTSASWCSATIALAFQPAVDFTWQDIAGYSLPDLNRIDIVGY